MIIDVLIYRIEVTFAGSWATDAGMVTLAAGNYLHVFLDDTAGTFEVLYTDSSVIGGGTDLGTLSGTGPNLFYNGVDGGGVPIPGRAVLIYNGYYQWCDGTTLNKISVLSNYPYAGILSFPGASECVIAPVCDLEISSLYTMVPVSDPTVPDGSIEISATSSNGVIRFSLTEGFEYSTGQTSGLFSGLYNGTYTIYALDEVGCSDQITIKVTITTVYAVRHRLDFIDFPTLSRKYFRYDILERAYEGEIEEVCGGASPVIVRYEGDSDNPSKSLIPSNVVVTLMVETADQFTHLHTADDRKYKGILYAGDDILSLEVYHMGYAIPEFHSEPYIFEPYEMTVTFSDGLGELKNREFLDVNGNILKGDLPAIKIISEIFKHTGLPLNIRNGINVFDENMTAGGSWSPPAFPSLASFNWVVVVDGTWGSGTWTLTGTGIEFIFPSGLAAGAKSDTIGPLPYVLEEGRNYQFSYSVFFNNGGLLATGMARFLVMDILGTILINEPTAAPLITAGATVSDTVSFICPVGGYKIGIIVEFPVGTTATGNGEITVWDDETVTVTDDSSDPLNQLYIDTRIFSDVATKCNAVLERIAEVFRAQIFQSKGMWWLIRLSDSTGDFAYRDFDSEGEYIETDTFAPLLELHFPSSIEASKLIFKDRTQILSFMRNYGKFTITNDLRKDGNLIDEGRFEEEDVITYGSGNTGFKNWTVTIGQPGLTYGLEPVDNGDSLGAFFFDYKSVLSDQNDTEVRSVVIPMDNEGRIKFKFQHMTSVFYSVPYTRIAWGIKIFTSSGAGEYWLTYGSNGAITYDTIERRNDIYVTSFDAWQNFDIIATFSDNPFIANMPTGVTGLQVFFWFHNHYGRDFASLADLKAFPVSLLSNPGGTKKMVVVDTGSLDDPIETRIYTAEYLRDATESDPELILPDSYNNADGNLRWVWRMDKALNIGPNAGFVERIKLDNVSIAFYPKILPNSEFIDPVKTVDYVQEVSNFVDSSFSTEVLLGDMIRYDENAFRNEKRIYRSYLRLQNGTPTRFWYRAGVTEAKNLLTILLEDYVSQFSDPRRKVSATFLSESIFHFVNALRDNFDMSRYRPMTLDFDVKHGAYTMDLSSVVGGADGGPPVDTGEFSNVEFNEDYNIGG